MSKFLAVLLNSNEQIQICDSMYRGLKGVTINCLDDLYKSYLNNRGTIVVTIILMQKRNDSKSCGLFSIDVAADVLSGDSPANSIFNLS